MDSEANLAWKAEAIGDSSEEKMSWLEFSPRQREILHELPLDYTRLGLKRGQVFELDALARSRMVANSWHVGVAKCIIGKAVVFAESLRLEMVRTSRTVREPSPVPVPPSPESQTKIRGLGSDIFPRQSAGNRSTFRAQNFHQLVGHGSYWKIWTPSDMLWQLPACHTRVGQGGDWTVL